MGYKFKEILASVVLTQEACRVLLNGQNSVKSLNVSNKLFDQFLAVQDELYRKAKKKLPSMVAAGCFFTRRALEQSSSELLARWKSERMEGDLLFDLCGGLGSDALFMASRFGKVVSCDPDEELADLFRHNSLQMGVASVERLPVKAEDFLAATEQVADWIYFDPDRRTEGRRQTGFRHYVPEPESLCRTFAAKGKSWLIKLSPLDDLQAVYRAFPSLNRLWVLSSHGEVKELLLEISSVGPASAGPELINVEIEDSGEANRLASSLLPWPSAPEPGIGKGFLFEPSAGLIKSELLLRNAPNAWVSGNKRGTLWFAAEVDRRFPGRWTEIQCLMEDVSMKKAAKQLLETGIRAASVKSRELPVSSDEARKALMLDEGEDFRVYLSSTGKKRWLAAGKALRF